MTLVRVGIARVDINCFRSSPEIVCGDNPQTQIYFSLKESRCVEALRSPLANVADSRIPRSLRSNGAVGSANTTYVFILSPCIGLIILTRGFQCLDCIANTQKLCRACGGGYCIIHYEGSTLTLVCLSPLQVPSS